MTKKWDQVRISGETKTRLKLAVFQLSVEKEKAGLTMTEIVEGLVQRWLKTPHLLEEQAEGGTSGN